MANCTNKAAAATVTAQVGDSSAPVEASFSVSRSAARCNAIMVTVGLAGQNAVLNISLNQISDSGSLLVFQGHSFWFTVSDVATAIGTQRVLNVTVNQLQQGAPVVPETWTFSFASSPNPVAYTGTPILAVTTINWQCGGAPCP